MNEEIIINQKSANEKESAVIIAQQGGSLIRNLEDAVAMSKMIAASNIVPTCYRKLEAAFAGLELARELGIPPMQFMQKSYYLEKTGRIGVEVEVLLSLVYKSNKAQIKFGFDEEIDMQNDKGIAFCEIKRRDNGMQFRMTYSIIEAKKAGLMSKDNWKHPKDMLLRRVIGKTLKLAMTDVILGVATLEEMEDESFVEGDFSLEDAANQVLSKSKSSVNVIAIDELLKILKDIKNIADDKLYSVIYSAANHLAGEKREEMRNKYFDLCAGKGKDNEDVPPMKDASTAGYDVLREYVKRLKPRFELWAETMKKSEPQKMSSEPVSAGQQEQLL